MGVDPVWVILRPDAWLDEPGNNPKSRQLEKQLLGAVIPDFYDPRNTKPLNPSRYWPKIADQGISTRTMNDFVLNTDAQTSTGVEGNLTKYLGAKVTKASTTGINLSTKAVTFRRLKQTDDYWKEVRNDESLREVLPGWIKRAGKHKMPQVCLIVGIGICQGVEAEWNQERIKEREAQLDFPLDMIIDAAVALPPSIPMGLDSQLKVAEKNTDVKLFRSKSSQRSVFALELQTIQIPGWNPWTKKQPQLGRGPNVEEGHGLGDGDEEDGEEIDVDKLELYTPPDDLVQVE
jgi:hypothetical protein